MTRRLSLDAFLDVGDALVAVDDVRLGDVVTLNEAEHQLATVHVAEVRYEVGTANQDLGLDDPAPPPIAPGDLEVREPLGSPASRNGDPAVSHLSKLAGSRYVLLLGYWAPGGVPGLARIVGARCRRRRPRTGRDSQIRR